MIGVGNRLARHLPGRVPTKLVFIYQQSHQLSNRDRGVCVIQLDGVFFMEVFRPATPGLVDAEQILQGT